MHSNRMRTVRSSGRGGGVSQHATTLWMVIKEIRSPLFPFPTKMSLCWKMMLQKDFSVAQTCRETQFVVKKHYQNVGSASFMALYGKSIFSKTHKNIPNNDFTTEAI